VPDRDGVVDGEAVRLDTAMRVTTDAVQLFGGAGYTRDFPSSA